MDDVLSGKHLDKNVVVGYTPEIYRKLGMPTLPLVIGAGHIYSVAKTEAEAKSEGRYKKNRHYHGLGDEKVKKILQYVSEPVIIISAKDVDKNAKPLRSKHSVVAIVDIGTKEKSLLIPIEITAERDISGRRIEVNVLSSVYERNVENLVAEAIAQYNIGETGIYYMKKEADKLIGAGVQFPKRLQNVASDIIIQDFPGNVNMKILDITQSRQFKEWFGDWQNHPERIPPVLLNEDGTPKVFYHGTGEIFSSFSFDELSDREGSFFFAK